MKIRAILSGGIAAVAMALLCGCVSEELSPASITYDELSKKMVKASDPRGLYTNSQNSVQRQEVVTEHWLDEPVVQMVEVKYAKPDCFCWTTFDDNKPTMSIITNGNKRWVADYNGRKIIVISPEEAEAYDRIKVMSDIASPTTRLDKIFSIILIEKCKIKDNLYYKLTCKREEKANPIYLYVGYRDFLIRRLKGVFPIGYGKIDYDAKITRYALFEGVRIPAETDITVNGEKQHSRVVMFKLNTAVTDSDFRPPVF